jgi:hypothetical protein
MHPLKLFDRFRRQIAAAPAGSTLMLVGLGIIVVEVT